MRYQVNDNCIGCGLCAGICPEVFSMTDEGTASAIDDEVGSGSEQEAQTAMNSCPVDAIESD